MDTISNIKDFSKNISSKILIDYSLRRLNWFGLGGTAKVFFRPENLNELVEFLKRFGDFLPIKIIGAGSNILIRDGGFKGIIIKLGKNFSNISKLNEDAIIAGSLTLDKNLSQFALDNDISGFEYLSCIPGTIGGAIRMNSGCYEYDISKSLISVQTVDLNGLVKSIDSKQINFKYRGSDLSRDLIFLSATLKGKKLKSESIIKKRDELILMKKKSQPSQIKTCGSTFRNPINKTDKKSWQLIKESNCEKMSIGGAAISEMHSNFFINNGEATACDMEDLINEVQMKVLAKTGIKLELELEIFGERV